MVEKMIVGNLSRSPAIVTRVSVEKMWRSERIKKKRTQTNVGG